MSNNVVQFPKRKAAYVWVYACDCGCDQFKATVDGAVFCAECKAPSDNLTIFDRNQPTLEGTSVEIIIDEF